MASPGTTTLGKTPGGGSKNWMCDPRAILAILAVVSFIGALFILYIAKHAGAGTVRGLALFIGLGLFLSFLYLFTGAIGKIKMTGMVVFCYGFTAFAIVASVVPFALFDKKWSAWNESFRSAPIGVIKGCSVGSQSGAVPDEIKCAPEPGDKPQQTAAAANYQWVVNIGGSVSPSEKTAKREATGHRSTSAPAPSGSPGQAPAQGRPAPSQATAGSTTLSAGETPAESRPERVRDPEATEDYARIHGGIVVPLYVIVLALVGGAVSMTRRVPEYQRQVWMHYWSDDEGGRTPAATPPPAQGAPAGAPPATAATQQTDSDTAVITGPAAREYLVFQLMQVVSAPLIAIVAYYAFAPTNPTASVAVGFASGFTSETILLSIRGLADKLTPSGKAEKPPE